MIGNVAYLQKDGLSAKPSVLVRDDLMLYQTWLVAHKMVENLENMDMIFLLNKMHVSVKLCTVSVQFQKLHFVNNQLYIEPLQVIKRPNIGERKKKLKKKKPSNI